MLLLQDHPTVTDIHKFIHAKGLARVQLKEQDILTLLQTLIADGRYVPATKMPGACVEGHQLVECAA